MEFMDASQEFSASNDLSVTIKRKRTKRRQRPLSPVGRAAAVTHTSSSSSGGGGGDRELLGYTSEISASTSTDQEDEDMANCLILLAQGESCRKKVDEDEIKMEKSSSRKFNEMVTSTTGGKVGFFVYECKTCKKTFPSFQALGGHRTSHKKPKVTTEEKKAAVVNDDHRDKEQEEEENEEHGQFNTPDVKGCLGTRSDNKSLPNNNKAKIHECGICGAEFLSGQALGGHMRRHRNALTSNKVPMILETTSTHDHEESSFHDDFQKPRNVFPLDLNLPAPTEDDIHRDLKFQFSPNQQQQQHHLVFSAPALVDCHY